MRPLITNSQGKKNSNAPTPAARSQPEDLEQPKKTLNKTPKSVYRADVNKKPNNKEIIKINQDPSPNLTNPKPAEENSISPNQQEDPLPKINVEKDDAELTAQKDQLQSTTRPASPTMSVPPTMPVSPEQNKREFSQPAGAIPIDPEYNSIYPVVQMTQNNTPTEALNNSRMKSLTEMGLQNEECSLKNIERMIQKMHKKIKKCNKDQDSSSSESVSSNSSCTELDKKKAAYLKALDDYCKAKKNTDKKKRVRIKCEELSSDSGEERRRRKFKCKEVKPLTKKWGRRSSSCNPPRSDYSLECRPKACTSCIDLDNLTSCTNQALNYMSKAFNAANICPSVCCNYHECCHQEKSSESLNVSCEPDEQPIIKISYSDAKCKKPKQAKKTSCLEKTLNEILCKTKSIQDATEQLTATAPVCSPRSGNASYYMPCHQQQQHQPACPPSTSMHQPCSPRHCPLPPCPPPPCPRPRCPPPPCPPPLCPPSPYPQPLCPIPYPPAYPAMQYSHTSYLPSPSPLIYPPTGPHPSHPHVPYYTACYSTPYRYQFHNG